MDKFIFREIGSGRIFVVQGAKDEWNAFMFTDGMDFVERKDISEGLSDIIKEYLPGIKDDTKMKTEKGLEKYYKKHQNTIIKELGIENSQEFIALVKKMKSSSANFKKWDKLTINKDSFVDRKNDDYSYFEMTVTYDNNKSVDYSVYLANEKTTYPRFKVGIKK